MHITIGDENWNPTDEQLKDIEDKFKNARFDPTGVAVVATRSEVFAKVIDIAGDFTVKTRVAATHIPEDNSLWMHKSGDLYRVLFVTNLLSEKEDYIPTVVYEHEVSGIKWSRPLTDWARSMTAYDQKLGG